MTYVILSRFTPQTLADPKGFKELTKAVSDKIKAECPGVIWKESYSCLGRFDVVDIVEADHPKQLARATAIISSLGHATTETLPAIPWKEYEDMV